MKEKRRGGAGPSGRRDYDVGYGRPPVSKRFQTGGIGNPRGRPKRKKTIGQSIEQALMAAHKIEENGRVKILTAQEIIIRNLIRTAARGNTRAIQTLFALRDRYHDSPQTTLNMSDLDREDQRIIQKYLGELAAAAPDGGAAPEGVPETSEGDAAVGSAITTNETDREVE
jgi:hypothetical protein